LISNQQLDCLWSPEIQKPAETSRNQAWVAISQQVGGNQAEMGFECESCADYLEISGNHVCLDQPRN